MLPPAPVTPGRKNPLYLGMSDRLRKARKAAGLTPTRLSLLAGLADNAAANLEAGGRVPGIDTIEHLARVLGMSACVLAFGVEGERVFQQKIQGGRPVDTLPVPGLPGEGPMSCDGFAARLHDAREKRGHSVKALARIAELPHSSILNYEAARTFPGLNRIEQLAAAVDVSPCWLAFGVGVGVQQ